MTSTLEATETDTDRRSRGALLWRSPHDQPAWARPALLVVAALATALYAWNIADAGYSPFYSMAVKSMSTSWKALFYGAVDPRASITVDKLAGSFVPQALSARIFGYHPWSLELPQVLEGTVSVLVMYRVVRRWIGGGHAELAERAERAGRAAAAGLLAAAILAFTPVVASMFEHTMEDGALTMCLVLAADRYQYAVMNGRLRSLLAAGAWVGLGFQAKMIEAWMILPALALGYLLTAPLPLRRRVTDAVAAGAVTAAVSLSWLTLLTLTPAADRPYVDGSTDNSAFATVFGYNGLSRLGIHVTGALPTESSANVAASFERLGVPPSMASGVQSGGVTGWTKLFGRSLGPEVGWLYPLALGALVAGLWWYRRRPRADVLRGGFVLWGAWLATVAVVFSATSIPHTAYLALLAPAIAALCAAGIALAWRTRLLAAAAAVEVAWAAWLTRGHFGFLPWLVPTVVTLAALAVAGTLLTLPADRPRVARAASVAAVVAMLGAPFAWAASTLDTAYAGTAIDASAGPVVTGVMIGGSSPLAAAVQRDMNAYAEQSATLSAGQSRLLAYVDARRGGAAYAFATDSWIIAQPYIAGAGVPVLPMGGFSGAAPYPTPTQARQLVTGGELRFFLLNAPDSFDMSILFGGSDGPSLRAIDAWVRATCTPVPPSAYGGARTSPVAILAAPVLYACGSAGG